MSMIINTNVMAMNAQRNLSITSSKMGKALEQLSSGLRINRAADDAAGLAISEKMRAQVNGMQQGLRNAQDGVSMIQTAEGALSETTAILQRMRELTVQAGSTTLSTSDRQAIGDELVSLKNEIDNIATRTRFNGLNLLTGDLSVSTASTIADITGASTGVVSTAIDVTNAQAGTTYTLSASGNDITLTNGTTNVAQTITLAAMSTADGVQSVNFDALGVKLTLTHDNTANAVTAAELATGLDTKTVVTAAASGNASYRVGSETGDNVTVAYGDMRSTALGTGTGQYLNDLVTDNNAVSTTALSSTLQTAIDDAINEVSTQRAKLGASQNQMESAINSLGVSVENLSASESRIRDADIAQVSSELVTRQIMQQAGVAVLAQANSRPAGGAEAARLIPAASFVAYERAPFAGRGPVSCPAPGRRTRTAYAANGSIRARSGASSASRSGRVAGGIPATPTSAAAMPLAAKSASARSSASSSRRRYTARSPSGSSSARHWSGNAASTRALASGTYIAAHSSMRSCSGSGSARYAGLAGPARPRPWR